MQALALILLPWKSNWDPGIATLPHELLLSGALQAKLPLKMKAALDLGIIVRNKPVFMLPPKSLIAVELELLCLIKKCQGTTLFHFPSTVTVGCSKSLCECVMENWGRVFPLLAKCRPAEVLCSKTQLLKKEMYSRVLSHQAQSHVVQKHMPVPTFWPTLLSLS